MTSQAARERRQPEMTSSKSNCSGANDDTEFINSTTVSLSRDEVEQLTESTMTSIESVDRRNLRERKRVGLINHTFATLSNRLPSYMLLGSSSCRQVDPDGTGRQDHGTRRNKRSKIRERSGAKRKPSKVDTLRAVIEYIRCLQKLLADNDHGGVDVKYAACNVDDESSVGSSGERVRQNSACSDSSSNVDHTTKSSGSGVLLNRIPQRYAPTMNECPTGSRSLSDAYRLTVSQMISPMTSFKIESPRSIEHDAGSVSGNGDCCSSSSFLSPSNQESPTTKSANQEFDDLIAWLMYDNINEKT